MAPGAAAGYADAVIVAAGTSRRMGQDKLLAPLLGRPLLAWALEGLAAASSVRRLIVVVAPERVAEMAARPWLRATGAHLVAGGPRRQASVAAGLAEVDAEVVLVHDGARPLVTPALADRVAAAALERGAAVPVQPLAETLKRVHDGSVAGTSDRAGLAMAQTPQGARLDLLRAAMSATGAASAAAPEYTDEAAILEAHGVAVAAVDGEPANLKVTTPGDLQLAETLARRAPGGAANEPGPGQPPLRARRRAGAWAASSSRPRPGCTATPTATPPSTPSPTACWARPAWATWAAGSRPATRPPEASRRRRCCGPWSPTWPRPAGGRRRVDLQLEGARPHLGGARLDAMRDAIAVLLGLDPGAVSVRASTGNLDGATGAGRSIAAAGARDDRAVGARRMSLQLRNTLGGRLEPFEPLEPGRVRMYSCGPTVYAAAHVGNFRSFVFADLLRRYLGWSGYDVRWVMNITDVDDRIIAQARARRREHRRADRAARRRLPGGPGAAAGHAA